MQKIELKLKAALEECDKLRRENDRLKNLLQEHRIPYKRNNHDSSIIEKMRAKETKRRIGIFNSLFKGRTDVYPIRWKSKDGSFGYSPACNNKWDQALCNIRQTKCKNCPNSAFVPLTDKVIYKHLSGEITIGVYPLLQDDTCFFLALDFDKKNWKADVSLFIDTCKQLNIPYAVERSRSGNGCHVWFFFDQAIPAALARKLGDTLLENAIKNHNLLGFDSYDRMFPTQDFLSSGGFGNLIALPLQGIPRKLGNSVFLNESFEPYKDQWAYLSNIKKISKDELQSFLHTLETNLFEKTLEGTLQTQTPDKITIQLKNGIIIKKSELPSALAKQFWELSSLNNPAYYKAKAQRFSTHKIPKKIFCGGQNENELIFPRGLLEKIEQILNEHSITFELLDSRINKPIIDITFNGELLPQQQVALENLLEHSTGTLMATTGFGKTVVAAALIAKRKVNTLIIVNRNQLLEQWKASLLNFFDIDSKSIGQISGGKIKPTGIIDIATIQTLTSKPDNLTKINQYSQIIIDESHHFAAVTFENVLKEAEAKYIHGLTATLRRKDGLHPIITMQCGPVRYKVNAKQQAKVHTFNHILIPRFTSFKSSLTEESKTIQALYKEIADNNKRNDLIFDDVLKSLDDGRNPIILTERRDHIEKLYEKLKGFAKNIIVLTGGLSKKEEQERLQKLKEIPRHEERVILAIGKYIGEGFDDDRLDTLFLTMPVSWKGTLQQYVGRLHRMNAIKKDVKVYDYVDIKEPKLQKMYEKRLSGYKSLGYKLMDEIKETSDQMRLF
ncbi:MAG TPA: DEAD/DEAH box helicase family protein [Bacillales bacterium]|nr:DEAD/DEAH box helicase family protein [Bacillales bacterium]